MSKLTLTLLETFRIQNYIFNSNRLQENIGASEIVARATTLWAFEALEQAGVQAHNIQNGADINWSIDKKRHIETDSNLQAEVIQAAGGNILLLFREKEASRKFTRILTLRVLKDAPGLMIQAQHNDDFEFGKGLFQAISSLRDESQSHKLSRRTTTPLLGLGVTAICDSTGLPAQTTLQGKVRVNGKLEPIGLPGELPSLISSESAKKRGWRTHANLRLNSILNNAADDFIFPFDLEKLGRNKGEESYIAVIHADGNRMGTHIQKIGDESNNDREFINNLRKFSEQINLISTSALESVVGLVVQAVKKEEIPAVVDERGKYLPFRPLVFGGDDVTFVCNGLIGVSLAVAYLEAFEREAIKQDLPYLHASAGVSIVKLHYPFARAYKLAEELTASAKSLNREPNPDQSALDWHFAQSGLSGSLKTIRQREYTVPAGKLHLRPLVLKGNRSWQTVKSIMTEFTKNWVDKHNKVVGLREVLRKGPDHVQKYLQDYDLNKLPNVQSVEVSETAWYEGNCYHFDAIELIDHFVSLEPKEVEETV